MATTYSRRDSQWVKYFKLVIIEIPNVQFGLVFLIKPVTYLAAEIYKVRLPILQLLAVIMLLTASVIRELCSIKHQLVYMMW